MKKSESSKKRSKHNLPLRSGWECTIADTLIKQRVPFLYEPWELEYLKPNGTCHKCGEVQTKSCVYVPDFVSKDGSIVVEAKGKFTGEMRSKMLYVAEQHPDISFRMLFMRDNWLTKLHKSKYSEWCDKYDIQYAIGEWPKQWSTDFRRATGGINK